jgi:hypothetical protein
LKQSLEDSTAADRKQLDAEKAAKEKGKEDKASFEGDLTVAEKQKKEAIQENENIELTCQRVAIDHTANVDARKEEIKAVEKAIKVVEETTGGAEDVVYEGDIPHPGGPECEGLSFLQVASSSRLGSSIVDRMQNLAKLHHSKALAQLASKIAATFKYRARDDPFTKVKGLIEQMIAKLEKQMSEEAVEKAYCDDEMSKTKKKYDELEDSVASLTADIDTRASKSAKLKEEVSELESQLAIMAKEQAESDQLRRCEKAAYEVAKKDLEEGLAGVRKAMMVLRQFYGTGDEDPTLLQEDTGDGESMSSMMKQVASQPAPPQKFDKATGAGAGILAIMEVIETDLAKNLAKEDTQESTSVSAYEKTTQAFKVSRAETEQDVKYKTQEYKALDKSISELESDKATDGEELSAVTEYFEKLKERCIAKPSTYEERKAKREAEIEGLKEALQALENDALMQLSKKSPRRGHLRGDSTLSTD